MTLDEIVNQAQNEYGARFSVKRAQIIKFADYVQKIAFNRDLLPFLVWNAYLETTELLGKGPYPWPTTIPVRKMVGVTTLTDEQLLADPLRVSLTDYGFDLNAMDDRRWLQKGRHDVFGRTFTFALDPEVDDDLYRWVYFRRAPTITGTTSAQDANLILPEEFHQTLMVDGVGALCDKATWGDKTPEQVLEPFLQPFWDFMLTTTPCEGKTEDNFSQGQP